MPSESLVTVPSLRASAPSLTFSMRVLISSLISDGLSVVVAIVSFPWRCAATCGAPRRFAFRDWGFGLGDSESRNLALSNQIGRAWCRERVWQYEELRVGA